MTVTNDFPGALIESCQGLVKAIAARVHTNAPRHVELDDLIGYGEVGLAEAARDFDQSKGVQFSTFAYYRIRGAIYDGLSKMAWTSRSRYARLRYQQNADIVLEDDAHDDVGDDPSGKRQAVRFRGITDKLLVVYLATFCDQGGDGGRQQILEDTSSLPPPAVAVLRENAILLQRLVEGLTSEAATLIRHIYYDGGTLQEAAEKLGISKSWASRLHAKTLEQLACSLRQIGLTDCLDGDR